LILDAGHKKSISRGPRRAQPRSVWPLKFRALVAQALLVAFAPGALFASPCSEILGLPYSSSGPLKTRGVQPVTADLAAIAGHHYLVEVGERDNDVLVEILNSNQQVVARADHPEPRSGTRRAQVTAADAHLFVRITGKEHANAAGEATVRVFDLQALADRPECLSAMRSLATADADYAAGQDIFRGLVTVAQSARDVFARAAAGYATAERALRASGDGRLRGETELALAGIEYFDLQDYPKTVDWADAASTTFANTDRYRRARAAALRAAAWIEIGKQAPQNPVPVAGAGSLSGSELLVRSRGLLRQLSAFHLARGERYDAALQLNNIGITYYYQGRYRQCITAYDSASRLFGELRELQRRAQSWQNAALCYWGLGQMQQVLYWSQHALAEIGPQPYPDIYLNLVNNAALADYALGRYDEALRLHDIALDLAQKIQSPRQEGYALYGIGEDYYALGDAERARPYLERSLTLRTVAVDGRGRMATLRALATINGDQGRVQQALAADREALQLAVSPPVKERIRIQLAVHTAAAGQPTEAVRALDEILQDAQAYQVIRGEALLQRGVLRRELGQLGAAQTDLNSARTILHGFGSLNEEFAANLELARILTLQHKTAAALGAVERALRLADAVRVQSSNPELRSELQAPLRAGYDLKIELLREEYEAAAASGHAAQSARLAAAAFVTADAARAHSLAEVAAERYPPAVQRELAPGLQRREALYRELASRRFVLEGRLERAGAEDAAVRKLITDIAEFERQIDMINTDIALHTLPEGSGQPDTTARLPRLPADTALITYWLGAVSAYAWVVEPQGLAWKRLPSSQSIGVSAAGLHQSLARLIDMPKERRLEAARALYALIVEPLGPSLANARHWIVVPDGALDYVPFAALRGADGYIVAQHDVALTPAVWMLQRRETLANAPRGSALLLVADPVYQRTDPRLVALTHGQLKPIATAAAARPAPDDYPRLAFAQREAAGVRAQFPQGDVDELTGLSATRKRFLALDLSRYRYIHVATHGIVDAQVPQLSALILGSYDASGDAVDGAVRVADLSLLHLTADVAVFSACDTALGKQVPSEGLVGISSTVLARGARAVVASLWPVSDEMSAELMTEFYRHLVHDSMSAPQALGNAMQTVLRRDGSADPSLWAAYQTYIAALNPTAAMQSQTLRSYREKLDR
jgi:CHAT domain-containing protein/tetratricopeptide (TPR) repeat protein